MGLRRNSVRLRGPVARGAVSWRCCEWRWLCAVFRGGLLLLLVEARARAIAAWSFGRSLTAGGRG